MDECFYVLIVRKLIRKQIALMTGYFGRDDPNGVVGLTLLIVPGVHARLSNITKGLFVEHEQFEIAGKITIRKKGSSVKGFSFVLLLAPLLITFIER